MADAAANIDAGAGAGAGDGKPPAAPPKSEQITVNPLANAGPTGATVEVDNDADSTYSEDYTSETTSIASSIYEHHFENGRTYHSYKAGKYIMPNDEKENDRLDIHHHIALLHLGGELHAAPIGNEPSRILDLGTGTGMWAMDMGDKFPNATVHGIDLSPSQPRWVPPNVHFEIDDLEDEWTYSRPFDFIHARFLAGSIRDWQKLVEQCFKHLKPGGWVEFKDWDVNMYSSTGSRDVPQNAVKRWHDEVVGACLEINIDPCPALKLKEWSTKAGFTNIQEKIFPVPAGSWPKDPKLKLVGKFYGLTLDEGANAISMRVLTQVRGWSPEEVHVLVAQFRDEMKRFPFYHKYHILWAQKPFEAGAEKSMDTTTKE